MTFDKRADKNHDISSPVEVSVGLLPFWKLELEGEIERHPGENTQWEATTIENYFMLTEPGKYWLDVALFAEFARATNHEEPNTVELGLLMRKEHMNWLHTLNLFWEKPVGSKAEPIRHRVLCLAEPIPPEPVFPAGHRVLRRNRGRQ